jgi:HK97 family phage major capsid protein
VNYKDLQEKREKLVADARERLNLINDNTDESRARELESQHDAAMADLDALDSKIAREARVSSEERKIEEAREAALRSRRPGFTATETSTVQADGSDYRASWHAYIRAGGNVASLSNEERAALQAGYGETRAQTAASGSAGGYTVPSEMLPLLVESMKAYGPLYDGSVAFELVTNGGNSLQIPTINDTANAAALHTQGAALANDGSGDAVFGQATIGAYSYATPFLALARELSDDSIFAVEQVIARLLGTRLGRIANTKLTVGTGSSQPQGIVTGAGAGNTSASPTAFTADELIDLFHSVDPAYRTAAKAAWMMNDATLAAVRKLKDSQGRYIWSMGDIQNGVPASLLGKPLYVNQDMANIGATSKPVLFGDLGQFMVRKVGAPLVGAVSDSAFWPGSGIAGFVRFDSKVLDTGAIKVLTMHV